MKAFDVKGHFLKSMLEMTPSSLKTERRTLQDILANVFADYTKRFHLVWQVSFYSE